MDRYALATTLCFCLQFASLEGQVEAQENPAADSGKGTKSGAVKLTEAESLKKALREMPAEQKQRLGENVKAWKQLNPEQQQALRDRDALLKKRAAEDAAQAASDLPESERESFQKRYLEERKKLEQSLRQEMEKRRKADLSELVQRLKQEMTKDQASKIPAPEAKP